MTQHQFLTLSQLGLILSYVDRMAPGEARKLIRQILATGTVLYSQPHAIDRLKKHKMTMLDCENVLRGGVVDEPEYENGEWRYHVRTQKFEVVVSICSESELMIVTAWRLQ